MKTRKQKETDLDALRKDFEGVSNAYLMDFKGMTVGEDAQLREAVAKAKITYRVVKNTLARLAVEGTPLEPIRDQFVGTTAIAVTPDDPVSAAKVQIGKACRFVGQNAIQLHGGMGMTDEMAIGHYFKRATMIEAAFGNTDHHLARYEALSLARAA